jgi:hypothetical protein
LDVAIELRQMEENEAPLDGNGNSIPQTPVEPTLVKSLEKHKMSF